MHCCTPSTTRIKLGIRKYCCVCVCVCTPNLSRPSILFIMSMKSTCTKYPKSCHHVSFYLFLYFCLILTESIQCSRDISPLFISHPNSSRCTNLSSSSFPIQTICCNPSPTVFLCNHNAILFFTEFVTEDRTTTKRRKGPSLRVTKRNYNMLSDY